MYYIYMYIYIAKIMYNKFSKRYFKVVFILVTKI